MKDRQPLKLVIFGPQGAGKGTQARKIAEFFNLAHVCTGDLMRQEMKANSRLGQIISEDMKNGEIEALSEIATTLLRNRLLQKDALQKGFIIDGYPRNKEQLEILDQLVKLTDVFVLRVKKKSLISRLTNRLVCKECGINYNSKTNPTQKNGICDKCGGRVESRIDDSQQAIAKRLKYHQKETKPLILIYKKRGLVTELDGNQPIENVFEAIKNKLVVL